MLILDFKDRILYLSDTQEGKKHDKKIADECDLIFPKHTRLWQDTDFQGYQQGSLKVLQSIKKPKSKEFSLLQKAFNKAISRVRVLC